MTSPIDAIYTTIFGITEKSGTAFEKLAAIGSYVLRQGHVRHDARIKGAHSNSTYQLDVLDANESGKTFGEAKDYSQRNAKVGRDDLQKLAGALPDLAEINSGEFWSATGYTAPAINYAEAAEKIIGKPIELRALKFEALTNPAGIVMTVIVKATFMIPQVADAKWSVTFTPEGEAKLKRTIPEGQSERAISLKVESFYDAAGCQKISLFEITSRGYAEAGLDGMAKGAFALPGLFIKIDDEFFGVTELRYEMPIKIEVKEIVIGDDPTQPPSNYLMTIENHGGNLLERISEQELKKYSFDEDGRIVKSRP